MGQDTSDRRPHEMQTERGMLFDTHTNLLWYPDHLSDEFIETALAAKKAKMRLSPDVYYGRRRQ